MMRSGSMIGSGSEYASSPSLNQRKILPFHSAHTGIAGLVPQSINGGSSFTWAGEG